MPWDGAGEGREVREGTGQEPLRGRLLPKVRSSAVPGLRMKVPAPLPSFPHPADWSLETSMRLLHTSGVGSETRPATRDSGNTERSRLCRDSA